MIDGNKEIERDLRARGFDAAADRFAELTATGLAALSPVQGERGNSSYQCVSAWQDEWLEESGPHWGDSIAWATAYDIARRLDRLAALSTLKQTPAGNGEGVTEYDAITVHNNVIWQAMRIVEDVKDLISRELRETPIYDNLENLLDGIKLKISDILLTPTTEAPDGAIHEALKLITPPGNVWTGDEPTWQVEAAHFLESYIDDISPTPVTEAPDGGVRARIAFDHAVMVAADEMAKMTGHRFATSRIRKLVTDIAETLGSPATEIARTALAGSAAL